MVDVVVYTTPSCPQCMSTKRLMDKKGVRYREVDLTQNPDKLEEFKTQGHTSAPIVTTDTKVWSGFRFDKIDSLAKFLHANEVKLATQQAA